MAKTIPDEMDFIEIEKITEKEYDKKDEAGRQIFIPGQTERDGSPKKATETKVFSKNELITLDNIRSVQPWENKTSHVASRFKGELTMLFMNGDGRPDENGKPNKKPSILINESFDSFCKRVNAIRLVLNVVREEAV